ncbi:hypothetical protein Taro_027729 [Colocasia esculenta]|uniref:Uncharacterized protein n=1 Tax=Colocasia esculenta TaxID=4460 RepID=A0A843VGI5_COLES|nr:hypothetical protein [Colocasia esculenta]
MFRGDKWLQSTFAGTSDGKEVEGIVNGSNFWDRVFKLVHIIEPLYEVLRVVDGDRRPSIGLVYVKLEAAKKKIREVSPRRPNGCMGCTSNHRGGGEYKLDEEADDPEDPPRPNTFLARAIAKATTEEEGDRGNVGQPYSPQFQADPEAEVVLLQMLEVAVVVTVEVEVEVVTVVREEEMVTVLREEEVVGWHSQRSNFFEVQHKILVMVLHCSTIEGRSLVVAVM